MSSGVARLLPGPPEQPGSRGCSRALRSDQEEGTSKLCTSPFTLGFRYPQGILWVPLSLARGTQRQVASLSSPSVMRSLDPQHAFFNPSEPWFPHLENEIL